MDGRRRVGGIMNGMMEGDKEDEMTFTGGKGGSIINYVIGDRMAWENVERLEVEGKIDSDHQSISI